MPALRSALALHSKQMRAHHFSPSTANSRRLSFMRNSKQSQAKFTAVVLSAFVAGLTFVPTAFALDREQVPQQDQAPGQAQLQQPAPATEPAPPPAPQVPVYAPKYHGDPARSDSEFAALAYTRVVMRAQMLFNKHYGHYATTLAQLNHTGTFTQRMINPDRGDYTVGFKSKKDNYILTLTPKLLDPQHRSFYAENDGKVHADETKAADGDSPVVETHKWDTK